VEEVDERRERGEGGVGRGSGFGLIDTRENDRRRGATASPLTSAGEGRWLSGEGVGDGLTMSLVSSGRGLFLVVTSTPSCTDGLCASFNRSSSLLTLRFVDCAALIGTVS
jgi:hypothetical protein